MSSSNTPTFADCKVEEDEDVSTTMMAKPQSIQSLRDALSSFSFKSETALAGVGEVEHPILRRSSRQSSVPKRFLPEYTEETRVKKRSRSRSPETQLLLYDAIMKGSPGRSPSPKKLKRTFAAPEVYAHLKPLEDILADGLDVMFCGINPGQRSAQIGHHFAGPTNHFWPCLHQSGFTDKRLYPKDDKCLAEEYSLGLTNLVERPTAEETELSPSERAASVPVFLEKVARYRPRAVCFVGFGISKVVLTQVARASDGELKANWKASAPSGNVAVLQPYKLVHGAEEEQTSSQGISETLFYAVPSTSGRVVQFQKTDKIEIFTHLRSEIEKIKMSTMDTSALHVVTLPFPTTS